VNELDWESEITRLRIPTQSQLQIQTGNPDWNYAFALSQKEAAAFTCKLLSQSKGKRKTNLALSPLQALYLLNVLTPLDPSLIGKILEHILEGESSHQSFNGGGCSLFSELPALPIMGELVWQAIQITREGGSHYGPLMKKIEGFLSSWFQSERDWDRDGIPEITHPCQLNLLDLRSPATKSSLEAKGMLPFIESPGLITLLANDLFRLEELAESLEEYTLDKKCLPTQKTLQDFLQKTWNPKAGWFQNCDRDSHLPSHERLICSEVGTGFTILRETFPEPARISCFIQYDKSEIFQVETMITLHGRDQNGKYRIEKIFPSQILRADGVGWTASRCVYTQLDFVIIKDPSDEMLLTIYCPNTQQNDISLLLPLWGNLLDEENGEKFVNKILLDPEKYWSPHGIRSYPLQETAAVQIPWNVLVGQGLLNYQHRQAACELFTRIINATLINLNTSGSFYAAYDAASGKGIGSRNALSGLIPIGFFLQVLGVQIINNREVIVEGTHPFPWPIILRYRGLEIHRDQNQTRIEFPGEETRLVQDPHKKHIQLY
jgi:hypothetical protein